MRAVLRKVAKKYQKEIADKLKIALEDETKMHELVLDLESRGYNKSADTIERFRFSLGNYRHFRENTGEGYGLPTDWKESIRS
jgi:putative transposase